MFYSVLRNASQRGTFSPFRSWKQWCLFIFFSCCVLRSRVFGLSVAFWPLFALTLDREVLILTSVVHCVTTGGRLGGGILTFVRFSFSYGVPALSNVFSRKEASSDMVLICHAGQRFQTGRPTENLSFCSSEGSLKHVRGQRHHLVIL